MRAFTSAGLIVVCLTVAGGCSSGTSTDRSGPGNLPGVTASAPESESASPQPTSDSSPTAEPTGRKSAPPGRSSQSSSSAVVERCRLSQLRVGYTGGGAGSGVFYGRFEFTNSSSSRCYLEGYVGLQRLGTRNNSLPTNVQRDASQPVRKVYVDSGGTVTAGYAIPSRDDSQPSNGVACGPRGFSLEVTPPDEYQHGLLRGFMTAGCLDGRIRVGPVGSTRTTVSTH